MRRYAPLLAALLLGGCTSNGMEGGTAGTVPDEIRTLQAAIETAEQQDAPETGQLILIPAEGAEQEPCATENCRRLMLQLLQADLQQHPENLHRPGTGGIELNVPGRFWTMTFGADGGLLGASLTVTG